MLSARFNTMFGSLLTRAKPKKVVKKVSFENQLLITAYKHMVCIPKWYMNTDIVSWVHSVEDLGIIFDRISKKAPFVKVSDYQAETTIIYFNWEPPSKLKRVMRRAGYEVQDDHRCIWAEPKTGAAEHIDRRLSYYREDLEPLIDINKPFNEPLPESDNTNITVAWLAEDLISEPEPEPDSQSSNHLTTRSKYNV